MFSQVTLTPAVRRSFTSAFTLALVFGLLGGCTHQNSSTGADTASAKKGNQTTAKDNSERTAAVESESTKQQTAPATIPSYELSELSREAVPQEAPLVPPAMPKRNLDDPADEAPTAASPPTTWRPKKKSTARMAPTRASRSTTSNRVASKAPVSRMKKKKRAKRKTSGDPRMSSMEAMRAGRSHPGATAQSDGSGQGFSGVGGGGGHPLAMRSAPSAPKLGVFQHRPARSQAPQHNTENYSHIGDNPFFSAKQTPLSTFSIDVDTASYSNARRLLGHGRLPPKDAVRIEEMLNYFSYSYPPPKGDIPFSVYSEVSDAPWNPKARLVHIGLRGKAISRNDQSPQNLVFLIDVSGSMGSANKLPLLKRGLSLLARELRPQDSLAMVVYAGSSGTVLPPTPGNQQGKILSALERLHAGGSTNGASGIQLAYNVARRNYQSGGVNRVILATDGDFNVGTTNQGDLTRLIEGQRKSGVSLSVLGFGRGNLKDAPMETLADKGNGNYSYIDSIAEAQKVLVREGGSTLVTIAKDVKIQVEFNPKLVARYRLIGYENRILKKQDFNNDKIDAGEIGAGHTVTALYEIIPTKSAAEAPTGVDKLRYQAERASTKLANSGELLTLKLRYKSPTGSKSRKISYTVTDTGRSLKQSSDDFRFSAAVASYGMLLRGSQHRGTATLASARKLAQAAIGKDPYGDRKELLGLMDQAKSLGL